MLEEVAVVLVIYLMRKEGRGSLQKETTLKILPALRLPLGLSFPGSIYPLSSPDGPEST